MTIKEAWNAIKVAAKAGSKTALGVFVKAPIGLIVKVATVVGGALASAWLYIRNLRRQHRDITDYDDSELSPVEMIQKRNEIYRRHKAGLSKKERKNDRFMHDVSKFRMDHEVAVVLKKLRKGRKLSKEDRDILRDFEYFTKEDFHFDGDRVDMEEDLFSPIQNRRMRKNGAHPKSVLRQAWEENQRAKIMEDDDCSPIHIDRDYVDQVFEREFAKRRPTKRRQKHTMRMQEFINMLEADGMI